MKPFSYTRAEDTDAAIAIRSAHPQAAYLSGGTTLLDLMKDQVLVPDLLVDITRLPLRGIEVTTSGVHIGALTTMSEVAREPVIRDRYPMIAEALLEHTVMDASVGRIVNANLAEYLVPVHADIPAIDVLFVDEPDFSLNPIGVKGLGEIGLVGVAPAIANAVYHATGQRLRDLPITLDKLL